MSCVLGLVLLVVPPPLESEQFTDAAIAALESKGARVSVHATLTSVYLSRQATDEDMLHVAAIPNVKMLTAMSRHISDTGMLAIADLQLMSLSLYSPKITDAGLQHLSRMPLTMLGLDKTSVTAEGLEHLATMPKLFSVGLKPSQFTDTSAPHLQNIRSLRLSGDKITKEDILRATKLDACTSLSLSASDVEGLEQLGNSRIAHLAFFSTNLLPNQVNEIQQMTWLKRLSLYRTTLNDDAIDAIILSLPNTVVTAK